MSKITLATVWLDGCSGCHMSFLDMDQRLLQVLERADLVYSPLVDIKAFPEQVDVCVMEGAISSEEDLEKAQYVRQRSKTLVSLGDCAVTANVPAMRNHYPKQDILNRAYLENVTLQPRIPDRVIPQLLPNSRPVHEYVSVDVFVPGCPPSADVIYFVLCELLEGRVPDVSDKTYFGA